MPIVTVIIPYKNNLKYLFLTLKSILIQSYKKYKILIIYDDEKKSDLSKIKKFIYKKKIQKNLIQIISNKKNRGAGISRNIGLNLSKTKYVAFLDSDDIWHKNKLKIQTDFMNKSKQPITHTSYYIINEFGKKIAVRKVKKNLEFKDLINSCDIGLSTVMINLNFLKKNNLKFPKIDTKEDYVLWLRILRKIKFIKGIDKKLTYYRRRKKSLSSNKLTSIINGFKVYKVYLKMSTLTSILRLLILSSNYIKKIVQDNLLKLKS